MDSVDSRLNDWSLTKNTIYENQKIIDLLNMNAGDQKYVNRSNFKDKSGDVDTITISRAMFKMSNLKKSKSKCLIKFLLFQVPWQINHYQNQMLKNELGYLRVS